MFVSYKTFAYKDLIDLRDLVVVSHIAHIDHCSPLEFPVAQWLEHPTSVRTVVGLKLLSPHMHLSISIYDFIFAATQVVYMTGMIYVFHYPPLAYFKRTAQG